MRSKRRVDQIMADKAKLKRWSCSSPNDPNSKKVEFSCTAAAPKREYANYLSDLFRTNGLSAVVHAARRLDVRSSPDHRQLKCQSTPSSSSTFKQGHVGHFVKAMDRFHHTGLLHQVHDLGLTGHSRWGGCSARRPGHHVNGGGPFCSTSRRNGRRCLAGIARAWPAIDAATALKRRSAWARRPIWATLADGAPRSQHVG